MLVYWVQVNARDVPLSTKAITLLSNLKQRSKQADDKIFGMRADAITRAFDRAESGP